MIKAPRQYVGFKGTIRFACIACHFNKELYPKDDAESWFYMLIDITMPQGLSWRKISDRDKVKQAKMAARENDFKDMIGDDIVCNVELISILHYIDALKFGDAVDYNFIYRTLKLVS